MGNVIEFADHRDYRQMAIEKIEKELKEFKGDRYGQAVKDHVASTLRHFCAQDNRFAAVVYKTKRTLSDCCREIMKGCGQHISDIDVYRGAVRSYFPNADIDFHMTITLTGDAPTEEEMNRVAEQPKAKAPKKKTETKKPANKPEKKEPEKVAEPTKQEAAPAEKPVAPQPKKKPAAPGAIKPAPAIVPAKNRKKKDSSATSDPNMIQLSLF